MKKYLLLHYGFEKPTAEIMEAWGAWFESNADKIVEQGSFTGGRPSQARKKTLVGANLMICGNGSLDGQPAR